MTHYDKLIDSITAVVYFLWSDRKEWNELKAKEESHKILQMVEEYQSKQPQRRWRASD